MEETVIKKGRAMSDIAVILGFLAVWFVLNKYILPQMGFTT